MHPAQLIASAARRLTKAGCPSGQADARLLLRYVTGDDPIELLTRRTIDCDQQEAFQRLIDQRCRMVPIQHLTQRAYFRHVTVKVGPGVFIPRPETETVAGEAIASIEGISHPRFIEFCAGSGAIAKSICHENAAASGIAIEKSPQAYAYLEENVASLPITALCQDLSDPLPDGWEEVDLIVANPPYIPGVDIDILPDDVRYHDPHMALFAKDKGLYFYPILADLAHRYLREGGYLICEHGDDQAGDVCAIWEDRGLIDIVSHQDLTGRDRYVSARRPPRRERGEA